MIVQRFPQDRIWRGSGGWRDLKVHVSGEERLRPFKEDQGVNSVDSASDVLGLGAESIGFRMTFYNRGVLSDPNGIISG